MAGSVVFIDCQMMTGTSPTSTITWTSPENGIHGSPGGSTGSLITSPQVGRGMVGFIMSDSQSRQKSMPLL